MILERSDFKKEPFDFYSINIRHIYIYIYIYFHAHIDMHMHNHTQANVYTTHSSPELYLRTAIESKRIVVISNSILI